MTPSSPRFGRTLSHTFCSRTGPDGIALRICCTDGFFAASCTHGRVRVNGRKVGAESTDLNDGDTISMGGENLSFSVPTGAAYAADVNLDDSTAPRLFIEEEDFDYPLVGQSTVLEGVERPSLLTH